jgi:hypothetical protein
MLEQNRTHVVPTVRRDAFGSRMTKDAKTAIQHLRRTFHARGDLSGPETQSGRKESRDFANGPGAFTALAKSNSLRDGGAFGSRAAIVVVVVVGG